MNGREGGREGGREEGMNGSGREREVGVRDVRQIEGVVGGRKGWKTVRKGRGRKEHEGRMMEGGM